MKVRFALAGAVVLVVSACSSEPAEPESRFPPGVPTPDLATSDPGEIIYWQTGRTFADDIPTEVNLLFETIRASKEERWIPFLLDLVTIPTPYGPWALETLRERLGEPGEFEVFGWVEQRGKRSPEDDPEGYVAFKRRLYSTIQPELGAFLDPEAPRTISAQEVLWGGVRVDGIPPLESPAFVSAAEASTWIAPDDFVIGVEINGDARAYPRRIIDWHEMVNDTVGGVPVSLAYCTLCGSAILYDGRTEKGTLRFGTSGMLYRSNKLMYDRETRTLWQQFSGTPVWGELVGSGLKLKTLPAAHTTYAEWLADHPDTTVLSLETGFARDYGSGVAYREYFASPQLMFPAPDRSGPLQPKDVVFVLRGQRTAVAYPVKLLNEKGFLQDSLDGQAAVVFATGDGSGGRGYEAGGYAFTSYDAGKRQAKTSDGTTWSVDEAALVAKDGRRLARIPGHNSFWFAILNHADIGRLYAP